MFTTLDLENFLKEHEGEWWTPNEIRKELGVDLRTVKSKIRKLRSMTLKGWRLEIAERIRLYCVRMVRDIDSSRKHTRVPTTSEKQHTLDPYCRPRPLTDTLVRKF